jgi:hypothetical protein
MNAILNTQRALSQEPPLCQPDDDADPDGLIESIRIAMVRCEEAMGRADCALDRGDTDAAQDLLRSAIKELEEVATVESEA